MVQFAKLWLANDFIVVKLNMQLVSTVAVKGLDAPVSFSS